jgi:hypothetical protein
LNGRIFLDIIVMVAKSFIIIQRWLVAQLNHGWEFIANGCRG